MIVFLLLLAQGTAGPVTVGDTVWLSRTDRVPPGSIVQAPEWELDGDVELLGPPQLSARGDSVTLRFPLVAWRPGEHRVDLPGPVYVASDGSQRQVEARGRTVSVASVLPAASPDSQLPIRPEAPVVSRRVTSLVPLLLFLAGAVVILAPLHLVWRARRRPLPRAAIPTGEEATVPVDRWAAAGEGRVVLSAATGLLRHALARRCPPAHPGLDTAACVAAVREHGNGLPADEVAGLLRELDGARFSPAAAGRSHRLYDAAADLALRLNREETP